MAVKSEVHHPHPPRRGMKPSTTAEAPGSKFSLATLYEAARMYYLEEANQVQIAERMQVSRPTVSRLLAEARRVGLVRIEVINPANDEGRLLAEDLARTLGLHKAYVADGDQSARMGAGLSAQVDEVFADIGLTAGDVLLVSSGRTVYDIVEGVLPRLPGVIISPTVGGQAEPEPWYQTNEIARTMAEKTGGSPAFLFAQALPSPEMYTSIHRDASFQRIQRLWENASMALLGVGAPPSSRGSISKFIPSDDDSLLRAVGDICLNFFDAAGHDVPFPGSERMINTRLETLQQVPHTVAAAVGLNKASSIVAGAKAGYFNRLITDARTARAVIDLVEEE